MFSTLIFIFLFLYICYMLFFVVSFPSNFIPWHSCGTFSWVIPIKQIVTRPLKIIAKGICFSKLPCCSVLRFSLHVVEILFSVDGICRSLYNLPFDSGTSRYKKLIFCLLVSTVNLVLLKTYSNYFGH